MPHSLTVTYTGQLAEAAATTTEELPLDPGATLGTALDLLIARHAESEKFATLLRDDNGALRSTVLAVIDNNQATGDRESLPLDDARDLMFMTPIAGG